MKYIRLRARVTRAEWREERSKWVVRVEESGEDGKVSRVWDDECEVLLNGNGFLKYVAAPAWYIIIYHLKLR